MGLGLAQHVPEQDGFQLVGGDLGHFNGGVQGDGVAGGGSVQGGLGGGDIKLRAGLLRDDGIGSGVIGGVFHLAVEPVIQLLGGEGLGGENLCGQFHDGLCFGTVFDHILNRAAQFVIRNGTAISGGGDLKGMVVQLVRHVKRLNIQHG